VGNGDVAVDMSETETFCPSSSSLGEITKEDVRTMCDDGGEVGTNINDNAEEDVKEKCEEQDPSESAHQFAVPDLPGISSTKKLQPVDGGEKVSKVSDVHKNNGKPTGNDNTTPNKDIKNKLALKEKKSTFPYTSPAWGGTPPPDKKYRLTVLKEGIVRDTIDLSGRDTLTFGRHPNACDVHIEHPSSSRYHAVLQYCVEEKDIRKVGYYLYDLGSTHGSYVNKDRMRAKVYARVRVGYQIKFGGSSRRYIVEGPEEDQEEEVDMAEVLKAKEERKQMKKEKEEAEKTKEKGRGYCNDGASWGFGEDAQEEELDLKALMEKKKGIEVKDPKKTLKGFFEREGLDFEYEMSEQSRGTSVIHVARVRLPIESSLDNEIIAEGTSSNKKDAVLNCAMDACKIIQAYDMMQNPAREDEREKRQRELEANDFYDSDEDNYLDRTGSIEKKRQKRKQLAGKKGDVSVVQTHEMLNEELKEKKGLLSDLENKLKAAEQGGDEEDDEDSLDAFMSNIGNKLDKKEKSQLKRQILETKKEVDKLGKLVERTQPALPKLTVQKAVEVDKKMEIVDTHGENSSQESPQEEIDNVQCKVNSSTAKEVLNISNDEKLSAACTTKKKKNKKRVYSAMLPPPPTKTNTSSDKEKVVEEDKELVEWQPPEGQTGDGRTHLNEKFGY